MHRKRIAIRALVLVLVLLALVATAGSAAALTPRIAPFHSQARPRLRVINRFSLRRAYRGDAMRYRWEARHGHGWANIAGATHPAFTVPARLQGDAIRVLVTFSVGRARVTLKSNPSLPVGPPSVDSTPPAVSVGPLPTPYVPTSWAGPNPPVNCDGPPASSGGGAEGMIVELDYCGATVEGLAPIRLPANWANLGDVQQGFVLLNLERIARGETPILGESATLDRYAMEGAEANDDPDPPDEVHWLGSNWYGGTNSAAAVGGYIYDDGPDSGNLSCTAGNTSGCWGHRDNILGNATETDLAVGLADGSNGDSTELFGYGYTDFTFSWAAELAAGYPAGAPSPAALTPPTITQVSADGKGSVAVTGTGLDTVTGVYFAGVQDVRPWSCSTPTSCRIHLPPGLHPNTTYTLYLLNPAGLSAASAAGVYTTAP